MSLRGTTRIRVGNEDDASFGLTNIASLERRRAVGGSCLARGVNELEEIAVDEHPGRPPS